MVEVLHACPANCATGGPECIHAFVSELNKTGKVHARIWYWDIKSYPPMPQEYEAYGCEYVTEMPEGFNGVLIVPEVYAHRVLPFTNCTRVIYWLGLDAYAGWHRSDRGAFLADPDIIHIAQSEYAYDLLRQLKVKHLYKCVDLLNAEFYEPYKEQPRSDVVLYNPAKATPFQHRLMDECRGITFRPITGMTRQQVIETMRGSKLYLDFGEFPGRERMPREAALCGCVLITSRIGAAYYDGDFAHDYKFESKDGHIWAIARVIHYVLDHFTECQKDFKRFRKELRTDEERFKGQVEEIARAFNEVQHNHSGA